MILNVSGATGAAVLDISRGVFRIVLNIYMEFFCEVVNKFNSFPVNFPVSYHLKTPGTLVFSGVFREYKM